MGNNTCKSMGGVLCVVRRYNKNILMQVRQGYIMASVIYQWIFMANISFFHKNL